MFLLIVSYTKPTEEVALHRETHRAWVKKYLDAGIFLMAGPKTSTLGGAILTKSISKAEIKKIIAEDSFVIADVADYQIIEFDCKWTVPELALLQSV